MLEPKTVLYVLGLIFLFFLPILPNLWSIWHIFNNEFESYNQKMTWLLIVVFIPVIGGIAYILIGRKRVKKDEKV